MHVLLSGVLHSALISNKRKIHRKKHTKHTYAYRINNFYTKKLQPTTYCLEPGYTPVTNRLQRDGVVHHAVYTVLPVYTALCIQQ
jgi:hypothetical protein